jgi:DNA-binding transcriptional ArsR family regulator
MATSAATLDRVFHALADVSRRKMIDRLSRSPASVMELAKPLAMALPSVMKHLSVLETGGIVVSEKIGRERTYRLTPQAFVPVESWVAARKARWHQQLDQLAQFLSEEDEEDKV